MGGTAATIIAEAGVAADQLPAAVGRQLTAAAIGSEAELRSLRWELGEVVRALRGTGIRVVPLKGADFLLRNARAARGRKVSDLDLLIAPADLDRATAAFVATGWSMGDEPTGKSEGREHHLPVMIHKVRWTQLELHYQVVAEGGTIGLDVAALLAQATLQPDGVLALLSPEDTTLVTVAHFIRNKRFLSAFRDLFDLRQLVAEFTASDADFGSRLALRAERLGLEAALSRAARDSTALFGLLASPALVAWAGKQAPALAGGSPLVLIPDGATRPPFRTRLGRIGRMFARLRSTHPRGQALHAGWQLIAGGGASDE